MVIDYITGVMCAIADKSLSSEVGFKGICRKVLIFILVGIGNIIDVYVLGLSLIHIYRGRFVPDNAGTVFRRH